MTIIRLTLFSFIAFLLAWNLHVDDFFYGEQMIKAISLLIISAWVMCDSFIKSLGSPDFWYLWFAVTMLAMFGFAVSFGYILLTLAKRRQTRDEVQESLRQAWQEKQ